MLTDRKRQDLAKLKLAFASAVLAVGTVQSAMATAQTPTMSPAEAAIKTLNRPQIDALLATPDRVLVIDVRRADEISTIGGFPVFLNVQNADLERNLAFIPRDREIVTVSNHAHRAIRAAALLAGKGFRIAGAAGAQDYEAQGGTLAGKKVAAASGAASAAQPAK